MVHELSLFQESIHRVHLTITSVDEFISMDHISYRFNTAAC